MVHYLRAANVKDGELDLTDVMEMNFRPAEQRTFALEPGDVLVTEGSGSLSSVGASAVWNGELGGVVCFQNTLLRLRPRPSTDPRFLAWWCRYAFSDGLFASVATGANIFHVSADRVRSLRLRYVPLPRQRAIADYLDAETARIDALIAKKRRMIELLDERESDALDRLLLGLEADQTTSASSPFLSVVPHGWVETTIRHLGCDVQTGPFGSQLHSDEYVDGGWPVVNPANLRGGRIVAIANMAVSDSKRAELRRHILRRGDIVFGRRGEMGRAGLVGDPHVGWLCGTGSLRLRLRPSSPLTPPYLALLLQTSALRRYFELASIGSTMDNLNSDIVLGMPCLVPPSLEQEHLVTRVDVDRRRTAAAKARLGEQIELLREHRQALITAAVTGELDIPGGAA